MVIMVIGIRIRPIVMVFTNSCKRLHGYKKDRGQTPLPSCFSTRYASLKKIETVSEVLNADRAVTGSNGVHCLLILLF
jgi:hypothetical protein